MILIKQTTMTRFIGIKRRRNVSYDGKFYKEENRISWLRKRQNDTFILNLVKYAVVLILVLPVFTVNNIILTSASSNNDNHGAVGSFPYLYAKRHNFNASYPVIEYMVTETEDDVAMSMDEYQQPSIPSFLSEATGTYRIVEFYIHWCDICKHFANHYVQLGKHIQELVSQHRSSNNDAYNNNQTVEVYAISCAPHRSICRTMQINHYPSFLLYRPDDVDAISISHTQLVPSTILQKFGITIRSDSSRNDLDVDDSWYRKQQQQLLHSQETYLTSIPKQLLHYGRSLLGIQQPDEPTATTAAVTSLMNAQSWKYKNKYRIGRNKNELRDDIHTSFDYLMRYNVYTGDTNEPLSSDRAIVLQDFFHLLSKTIPITYTTLRNVIQALIDHFDYIQLSESYLIAILNEYPPPTFQILKNTTSTVQQQQHRWSTSCSYGNIDTGFTCGLWLLLHTITVGVVDYNRNVVIHHHRFATEMVAVQIRNLIHTFFSCEICRQNFVSSFDACAYQRCRKLHNRTSSKESDWIQLPLWLLETHNGVNVRLLYEYGQRNNVVLSNDDRINVIWPLHEVCPKCYSTTNKHTRNDTIMYKFLKVEYGHLMDTASYQFQEELHNDVADYNANNRFSESKQNNTTNTIILNQLSGIASRAIAAVRFHIGRIETLDQRKSDMYQYFMATLIDDIYGVNGASKSPLSMTQITALFDWYQLLRKVLPITWYEIHTLIDEVMNNWAYVMGNRDYLLAIVSEYNPKDNKSLWSSFVDTKTKYESTLLMDMLYVVSVGVIQRNKYTASSYTDRLSTGSVAKIIQRYVEQFTNRKEHRFDLLNSMKYVCDNENHMCEHLLPFPGSEKDWIELPMYLFEVHNVLLLNEGSKKRLSTIQRWPSPTLDCPKCWINDKQWDRDTVYKFILLLYGQEESTIRIGIQDEFFGPPVGEIPSILFHQIYTMSSV